MNYAKRGLRAKNLPGPIQNRGQPKKRILRGDFLEAKDFLEAVELLLRKPGGLFYSASGKKMSQLTDNLLLI